jgi:hypothetical protein
VQAEDVGRKRSLIFGLSATSGHSIDQEIAIRMTGLKVQLPSGDGRPTRPFSKQSPTLLRP